ncbi:hypothetical protein MY1884_009521 [Beauveria asiatica]
MSQRTKGDLRVAGENNLSAERVLTVRDTWPVFAGERPVASSGLCCMLVLIKKIYSFASDFWNLDDEANQRREQKNAFLALAWEDLSSTEPGAVTDVVNRIWGTEIYQMDLSEAVEARFGCWRIGDQQIVIRKTGSFFFFATFHVKNVAQDRILHFEQIRSFAFRVPPFAAKDDLPACPARTEVYNLATIVFQRQQPTDVDSIRVYEPTGMPRVPIGLENVYAWPSVGVSQLRNGESFFALYAITGDINCSFENAKRVLYKEEEENEA